MAKIRVPVRYLRKILNDIDNQWLAVGNDGRAEETSDFQIWCLQIANGRELDAKRITGIENDHHYDDIEFDL